MNNTFSMPRLLNVYNKMVRENWRELVMSLVMLLGVILMMMIFFTMVAKPSVQEPLDAAGFQVEAGRVLFTVFGCIAGSMMFGGMSTPRQRLSVLMTPASALEKYVARWITFVIGYIVAFAVMFVVADVVNYAIFRIFVQSETYMPQLLGTLSGEFYTDFNWGVYAGVYLTFTSLFALGSILWPKKALLKTVFVLALITLVYGMISYWAASLVSEPRDIGGFYLNTGSAHLANVLVFSLGLVLSITFYVISYYRFKESEVIDRW